MATLDLAVLDRLLAMGASATATVMASRDLLAVIIAFQNGWHGHTRVLVHLFREITSSDATLHARSLATFADALPGWIARHGKQDFDRLFPGYRRRRLVHYALILGRVGVLESFERCHVLHITQQDLQLAGQHGHLDIVSFLLPRISILHAAIVMDMAVAQGHLKSVEALHRAGAHASEAAYAQACANGFAHVARFLYNAGYRYFPWSVVETAAAQGHLDMIAFLHDIQYPGLDTAVAIAADGGHMDIVEYLFERRPYLWYATPASRAHLAFTAEPTKARGSLVLAPDNSALSLLVARVLGAKDLFRLLVDFQRGCDKATLAVRRRLRAVDLTMDDAATALPTALAPVHKVFPAWTAARGIERLCTDFPQQLHRHLVCYAVMFNVVPVLECFHAKTALELCYHDFELAGCHGHADVIDYLAATYDAPKLRIIMRAAVGSGQLGVVEQLLRADVALPDDAFQLACESGHLPVVEFLYERGLGGSDASPKHIVYRTTLRGHLPVLRFLHARSFDGFDKFALLHAVELGHLGVVQFLHEIRTEKMYGLVYDAVPGGHLDVVKFLHRNGYSHDIKGVLSYALTQGQEDIARFLREETAFKKRWARFSKQVAVKLHDIRKAMQHR
ncbi:ankyrin repeat protein L63-like [Achlya hypogyna]|uniref:Ankyrin repeat protein L63-like n=1 Tax=Achlya hypogyna TaxID=1202772 RepID=A0A1V9YV33_ACHHY|nr:ankyrin repeat protein L63-like [Achlya hypogyna]